MTHQKHPPVQLSTCSDYGPGNRRRLTSATRAAVTCAIGLVCTRIDCRAMLHIFRVVNSAGIGAVGVVGRTAEPDPVTRVGSHCPSWGILVAAERLGRPERWAATERWAARSAWAATERWAARSAND